MRITLSFMLCLFLIAACRKDEENECPTPTPQPVTYDTEAFAQLRVGSYWVYDGMNIDPITLNETPTAGHDSIYVAQDSLIGGKSYAWLKGTRFGAPWNRFARVDGPRIVGPAGEVWLDVSAGSDTIALVPGAFPIDSMATVLTSQLHGITTFLGPLASEHERDLVFFMASGFPSPLNEREHYVRDVGIGVYSSFFASSGIRVEMRLSDYHLEE